MKELIELMKASPGKYSVASPGAGTTPSLAIEMLKRAFEVTFVTVPFAGGAPLAQSLLGGFTPISCNALSSTMALIQAGKVRALALTSKQLLEKHCPMCRRSMNLPSRIKNLKPWPAYSFQPERRGP
jgi:tripartite-type tricarboxylate transporter receptor subunit TctC